MSIQSFIQTIRPEFLDQIQDNERLSAAIQAIENEDFQGYYKAKLKEILTQMNVQWDEDYLNRGILALQQYYGLAVIDNQNMHAVSEELDPFWHVHILFTADYMEFCQKTSGAYMHHDPLHKMDAEKAQDITLMYTHTTKVAPRIYNEVDPQFYPLTGDPKDMICYHYRHPIQGAVLMPENPTLIPLHQKYQWGQTLLKSA